jgi:hypothetical protein
MNPNTPIVGSTLRFLAIWAKVFTTNTSGAAKTLSNYFYYYYTSGAAAVSTDKTAAVITGANSFSTLVWTLWYSCLNARATGWELWSRWLDIPTDPWIRQAAVTAAGGIATAGLDLDQHVVIKKSNAYRMKNAGGRWMAKPMSVADANGDELVQPGVIATGGLASWQQLKGPLASVISGGATGVASTWKPFILEAPKKPGTSGRGSQIQVLPTVIVGSDFAGVTVNVSLGGSKKNKEKNTKSL